MEQSADLLTYKLAVVLETLVNYLEESGTGSLRATKLASLGREVLEEYKAPNSSGKDNGT